MIKWTEIEAECGDYKAGFVATYEKYKGQETDETDKSNRPVTVTVASFARHVGIPERTFGGWLDREVGATLAVTSGARIKMETARARKGLGGLPPEQKAAVVREVLADPEVARSVLSDPVTAKAVRQAEDEAAVERAQEQGVDITRPPEPGPGEMIVAARGLEGRLHVIRREWERIKLRLADDPEQLAKARAIVQAGVTQLNDTLVTERMEAEL